MWHENFVPRVDHLTDFSAQAAGYVVDKLMRFNCVSQELKRRLCELVARLRATVKISPVEVKGCDKLAQQWGLMCDLKLQVRQLLEFQTRHYSHV
ncbi:hypothetical protein KSX29_23670 [Photobacterium ganghwense]|nr:hypothetical protein [Photobacterium ganghwense]